MKAAELREMTREELRGKEVELSQQLFNLRLQRVTGQLENPAKVSQTRHDLARVLTVLGEGRDDDDLSAPPAATAAEATAAEPQADGESA
jgi:large subunit ribosomal protein L29